MTLTRYFGLSGYLASSFLDRLCVRSLPPRQFSVPVPSSGPVRHRRMRMHMHMCICRCKFFVRFFFQCDKVSRRVFRVLEQAYLVFSCRCVPPVSLPGRRIWRARKTPRLRSPSLPLSLRVVAICFLRFFGCLPLAAPIFHLLYSRVWGVMSGMPSAAGEKKTSGLA